MDNTGNIKSEILDIINTNVEKVEITIEQADEDLAANGMDSISFIRVVVALEAAFDIEYPDEYLLITQSNTLNKLVSIVSEVLEKKNERRSTE